jgi:L-2-hydroxyglutarate oxidase LhgO
MAKVIVIGAGVVGTAIARELARHSHQVTVIDKNLDVGEGTSKANTAILHTGFDAKPGTLESKLVKKPGLRSKKLAHFLLLGARKNLIHFQN